MPNHLDKLVASGVITVERMPDGFIRIKLTEKAWREMANATGHVPRTQAPPTHKPHPRKASKYD